MPHLVRSTTGHQNTHRSGRRISRPKAGPSIRLSSMANRTILITGGAGFLGINLARHLLDRGDRVVSLDIAPFDYPENDRVVVHMGDIRDRAAVDRAMEGVDAVVHTAAALPLYSKRDIVTTDIHGIRNVLESAHDHGVERVVHISSTAVYGIPDHHPLLETDQLQGVGPYGKAKIKAETHLRLSSARRAWSCRSFARSASSAPSASACSRCSMTGPRTARSFPILGQRQEPLPAPGRRGPLRRDRPLPRPRSREGERHLQHRREGVRDAAGRLPGGPR